MKMPIGCSLALVVAAAGCGPHAPVQELSSSPHYIQFYEDNACAAYCFELLEGGRYFIGMRREEIQTALKAQGWTVDSFSRPQMGWRSLAEKDRAIGEAVVEFEAKNRSLSVAACDAYSSPGGWHFLFFDDVGRLAGFERGSSRILYYSRNSANLPAAADAPTRCLLAFEGLRRPATEQGC